MVLYLFSLFLFPPSSLSQATCVAEYLFDLLVERPDGVGVIASSAYRTALQPCLLQSRIFDTPIELTAPGKMMIFFCHFLYS